MKREKASQLLRSAVHAQLNLTLGRDYVISKEEDFDDEGKSLGYQD